MSLKFYNEERQRWPALCAPEDKGRMGDTEIEVGIRRLAREFGLPLKAVRVQITRGCRHSCAGPYSITINRDWASWLVIAHEVAHTYWFQKYSKARRDGIYHGPQLARLIDRFCTWITAQGWHKGSLAHEIALMAANAEAIAHQRELVAATPPPIEARIARREAQVKRLTTKIKGLTSRLKSAQRSLAALNRIKDKEGKV